MYQNRHRNTHRISGHTEHTHKTIFKYDMAAILDMVAILKKKITNLKITNNKDLPQQLFQKVRRSNMLFILLGLRKTMQFRSMFVWIIVFY